MTLSSERALATLAALALLALPARAEPPVAAKEEARAHFTKGTALFNEGAWAAALAELLESRRLYPTKNATANAAECLRQLGRFDEALDLYEALLKEFRDIPADLKQEAQRAIVELRGLVGTIDVEGAEPGAEVTIDGRPRGEYPLLSPIRAAAGSHSVRVWKEGFEPFEARVDLAGGKALRVTAILRALAASGRARIVEQGGRALDVLVDNGVVGKTPWEGRLPVGEHVIVLRGESDLGTAPVSITVVLDRTLPLTLAAKELTAAIRLVPTPANASIAIDSVAVGRGVWEGRLDAGAHTIEVAAEGFVPVTRRVILARGSREIVAVALERDERSPFWKKPPRRSRFVAEVTNAAAIVPSFGGDVAGACADRCARPAGFGAVGAVHAGYELGVGLGFGVTLGYLGASQDVTGRSTTVEPVNLGANAGHADDRLTLRGVLTGAWVGLTLGERVPVHLRIGGGALIGKVSDVRFGKFEASDASSYTTGPLVETFTTTFAYVAPEARIGLPLSRHVELDFGLSVPILFAVGRARWDAAHPVHAGTDGYGTFAADALTGPVVIAIAPGIGARYDF